MPFNKQTGQFERVWSFVDQLESGDEITRTDLDVMANDLAAGITDVAALHLNYVGDWNPEIASFPASRPTGARIMARDAFVCLGDGTVGGVAFEAGETLVALVSDPGQTYAARWLKLPFLSLASMMSIADAAQGFADDSQGNAEATAADRVQTGLDRDATEADAIATAADRVQTGLDRTATGADVVLTGLDRDATAVDAVQTALDRVQTGLDAAAALVSQTAAEVAALNAVKRARSPGFAVAGAERITVDFAGHIAEIDTPAPGLLAEVADRAAGDALRLVVFRAPGFAIQAATEVTINPDGTIARLRQPSLVEDGAVTTAQTVRGPGYLAPDLLSADIDLSGSIVALRRRNIEKTGATYIARGAFPELRFDDATDIGWYDPDDVLLVLPQWGQSKTFGQNEDGDALISATPTYSGKAVMPSFGVHIDGRRFTGVNDLIESAYGSARETSSSALANHFIKFTHDAVGVEPHVLTYIAAKSAQTYSNLKRGSAIFRDLVNGLEDAKAYAASIGKVAICPAIFTNHGQNATDERGGFGSYVAAMQQFQRNICGAARSIFGQADDPQIIMTQVDGGLGRDIGASNFFALSTPRSQVLLGDTYGFTLAGNEGWLPVGTDGLHCTSEGYYMQGMMWARALFRDIALTDASALSVTNIIPRSTTVYDLEFEVPERANLALVSGGIVPAFTGIQTQAGLQFADAAGLINAANYSVTVIDPAVTGPTVSNVNSRWLRVTFTAAPVGILRWSMAARNDANGLGRSTLGSSATFAPIHTLPSGHDFRDYAIAQWGEFPALT